MTDPDLRSLIRDRLESAGLPPGVEASVVEELVQHVEDRRRDLVARGLAEDEALSRSLIEIEDHERLARELQRLAVADAVPPIGAPHPRAWFSGVWTDARYAIRTLRRTPAFTAAAILTVALSTGPTMVALGVANHMFWRPVAGVADADRLGVVWFGRWSSGGSFSPWRISYGHLADMSRGFTTIDAIAGTQGEDVNLTAPDLPARLVEASSVTANYFDVLGVRIAQGRGFLAEEDRDPSGALVTVVSHKLARALAQDGTAVGRKVTANGTEFTVIGVVDAKFDGDEIGRPVEMWFTGMTSRRLSHAPPASWTYEPHRGPFYRFILRLSPGATFEQAQAEFSGAAASLAAAKVPGADIFLTRGPAVFPGIGLEPLSRHRTWTIVRLLLIVGGVLALLGAANLVNLSTFRALSRTQEAAVRRALGASASRLARLHLIEAFVVASAGVTCGLGLAWLSRSLIRAVEAPGLIGLDVATDLTLVALAAGVATMLATLLALAPTRLARRASLTGALAQRSRGASRSGARMRNGLAVAQLSLSLMLLIGAQLYVRTLANYGRVNPGFSPDGVATMRFGFRLQGYAPSRTRQFYNDLLARLNAHPALEGAAATMGLPLFGGGVGFRAHLPGQNPKTDAIDVTIVDISADYFRLLQIPMIAGRGFAPEESFSTAPETGVVVSRALAAALFGTTSVVGRAIVVPASAGAGPQQFPIVGVAADVRWRRLDAPPAAILYRPFGTDGWALGGMLAVKSTQAIALLPIVRDAAAALDPALPIADYRTMTEIVGAGQASQRLFAWVLGLLAAIGFLLAAVGVHGLLSQVVTERTREFGIRLALGATRADVVRLVLRGALWVIAFGVPLGMGAAALSSGIVESQLFGVDARSPTIYIVAAAVLAGVVIVASVGPARRAARARPVDVLRAE